MIGGRMTIGDVARRTGASIKALRHYDGLGILRVAGRSESNYRVFDDDVIACVELIRALREAGVTLTQVQKVARRLRAGEHPDAALRQAYVEALVRTEIEIAALERKRERLRRLLSMSAAELAVERCEPRGRAAASS